MDRMVIVRGERVANVADYLARAIEITHEIG
jgi:hypothetical protein